METTGREIRYSNLTNRAKREVALRYKKEIIDYHEEEIEDIFMQEVEKKAQQMFGQVVLTNLDYRLELDEFDYVKMSMAIEPKGLLKNIDSLLYPHTETESIVLDFDVLNNKAHINLVYCDSLIDRAKLFEILDDDVDYFMEKLADLETYALEVGYKLCTVNKNFEDLASEFFDENKYTFIVTPLTNL